MGHQLQAGMFFGGVRVKGSVVVKLFKNVRNSNPTVWWCHWWW